MCVLRVGGVNLDPDEVLDGTSLTPYEVHRKGDPWHPNAKSERLRRPHEYSGFKVGVSDHDEYPAQVQDAIVFLAHHQEELARIAANAEVEYRKLDFRCDARPLGMQEFQLPLELVDAATAARVEIVLSVYAPDEWLLPRLRDS